MKILLIFLICVNCYNNVIFSQTNNINAGYCLTNFFNYYDTNDKDLDSLLQTQFLNTNVVRFPGGNISHYYNLKGNGYGFQEDDFPENNFFLFKNLNSLNLISKRSQRNYIYDFIDFVKRYSLEVIYVADLINSSYEEIAAVLNVFYENDINVKSVELGNELYAEVYRKKIRNVDDYINIAKIYDHKLKRDFQGIRTGVVLAPFQKNIFFENWNKKIVNEDFYDAIVVHIYQKIKENFKDKNKMYSLASKEFRNYLNYTLSLNLEKYNNLFQDKTLWITEWNLAKSDFFGNTMYQALFVSCFLNTIYFSDFNVEYLIYHKLLSNEYVFSLINPKWEVEKKYYNNKSKYINRASYYSFHLFNVFLELMQNQKFHEVRKSSEYVDDNIFIFNYDLFDKNKKIIKTYSYLINFSSKSYDVEKVIKRDFVLFKSHGYFKTRDIKNGQGFNGYVKYKNELGLGLNLGYIDHYSGNRKINFIEGFSVYLGEITYN